MATLPPQPSWAAAHTQRRRGGPLPAVVRKEPCPGSDKTLRRWRLRYSDLHSWLIFAPFSPSGHSRIPLRKIRQYYFIDVKTIIFLVIISFSEESIPATRCINICWPSPRYRERRRAVAEHKQRAGPLEVLCSQDSDAHQHASTL